MFRALYATEKPIKFGLKTLNKMVVRADFAATLFAVTRGPDFAATALRYFEGALDVLAKGSPAVHRDNFKFPYPFFHAGFLLRREKLVPPPLEARFRAFALAQRQHFVRAPRRHGNRELGVLTGAVALAQCFPNDPEFAAVRKSVQQFRTWSTALGDLDENAGSYSNLGLVEVIRAAQCGGWVEQLIAHPKFRETLTRYRDTLAPSGRMPEWGDDYFRIGGNLGWVFVFEFAAAAYRDPTFLTAADRIRAARRVAGGRDDQGQYKRAFGLLTMDKLKATPSPLPSGPQILHREGPVHGAFQPGTTRIEIDKLILRCGNEPGDPMLMMDLYGMGDHSHPNGRGSVGYFEAAGIPFFHNFGRYAQDADLGNLFWMRPKGDAFPGNGWQPDSWFRGSVPTSRFAPGSDGGRSLRELHLRNRPMRNGGFLEIDNVRLVGPSRTKMVDPCEVANWRPEELVTAAAIHSEGAGAVRLSLATEALRFHSRAQPLKFRAEEFPLLAYDVRYQSPEVPQLQMRFAGGYGPWHYLGQHNLLAEGVSASVRMEKGVAIGRVDYANYIHPGCSLRRDLALSPSGVLVVVDTLTSGGQCKGWSMGPLWQLYEFEAQGPDWAVGSAVHRQPRSIVEGRPVAPRRLMVILPGEEVEVAMRTIPRGPQKKTHTVFCRRLAAAEEERFVMVVAPIEVDADPETVAKKIRKRVDSSTLFPGMNLRRAGGVWRVGR